MTAALIRAICLGLIFSILSMGEYISMKVMNSPDLTVDGSFTTGGCICAMTTIFGAPYLGLFAAFIGGALCGCVTAFLQTKMRIQPLLAGILTMTGLYSINLRIMNNAPNVSLNAYGVQNSTLLSNGQARIWILLGIAGGIAVLLYLFFKTNIGLTLRACGDNENMVRSSSINVEAMKFLGLALSNGLVALSGALLVQFQNFADVTNGTGMLVLGLAGIIIGEAIFRKQSIGFGLLSCLLGAILYRVLYVFVLQLGFEATDMNLVSALLVALTISLPTMRHQYTKYRKKRAKAC